MFLHRVVLGSTVVVAFASSLIQTVVDDVDSKAIDTTMEPLAKCPTTVLYANFQHDGLEKSRHAQATFHFNPPHDGCYIVEEMHPMLMCEGSNDTKVHVHYCKGLQAAGTVDQSSGTGGQWTFLGALQFYAGIPGSVTLSNKGTEPGTLTVFDQVRFTWSGKDCMEEDAHPRRAEIRIKLDFQNVARRLPEFGHALTTKLAALANVPVNSLRLTGLRSGSIIAEFVVLPNVVEDVTIPSHSAQKNVESLRDAVAKNEAELCTLAFGGIRRLDHIAGPVTTPLENCNVEFKDLGFAKPTIEPIEVPVPEQRTQQTETQETTTIVITVVCTAAVAVLLLSALYMYIRRTQKASLNSSIEVKPAYETQVACSIEAGEPVKAVNSVEEDDKQSTLCPSNEDKHSDRDKQSDNQSESSVCVAPCKGRGARNEQVLA